MSGRVVIDWFPESRARYRGGWVVVAVDVIPATTTAVTAVAAGRACYPAANLAGREPAARLERPLLDGDVPSEFDLDNSPAALSRRTDVERPAVLLSTTGTRLLAGVASCTAVHAACLRNLSAQVRRLVTGRHQRVVVEKGRHASGWACYSAGVGDWVVGPQPRLARSRIAPTSWRQELSPGADRSPWSAGGSRPRSAQACWRAGSAAASGDRKKVQVGMAVLRPITDDDLDTVARFLHSHHDSNVPVDGFRQSFAAHHSEARPNSGVMLIDDDDVVGVYVAYYSDRVVDGRVERFCNLGSWCVLPKYRQYSLKMAKALLMQEGFHFLDLSPSATVATLNERLGFDYLDDRAVVLAALPWPWHPGRISSNPLVIEEALSGGELQLYNDHRDAPAAHHVVLRDRDAVCYLVLRLEKRKKLPVAIVVHASRPEMLRRMIHPLGGFALLRYRVVAVLVELRWLDGKVPAGSIQRRLPRKMYRSPTLDPQDIDYFYSELLYLPW